MRNFINVFVVVNLIFSFSYTAELKEIVLEPNYNHDKYQTEPKDIVRVFRAYITSFDSDDDNNGDGTGEAWGIPEWVSYEIKRLDYNPGKSPKRPSRWIHDKNLFSQRICPNDYTYRYSNEFRQSHPNWFDRGHMCMKAIAWRLGANADWNTHTVLNACPQKHNLNAGIWLDLENKTMKWADKYGSVWVICGPVFNNKTPSKYLGEKDRGEMLIAIPDAFFKVVVKENSGNVDVLAFIFPQDIPRKSGGYNYNKYFVSVDEVEKLTGLDFFTILPDDVEEDIEKQKSTKLWLY